MTFLTDLLEFKRDELRFGKRINLEMHVGLFRGMFGDLPYDFKIHETKTGLYLVLPHRQEGLIYHTNPGSNSNIWHGEVPINAHDLKVKRIAQGKNSEGIVLASNTGKLLHEYGDESRTPTTNLNFSVNYSATSDGKIIWLGLGYDFSRRDEQSRVSAFFEVYRKKDKTYPYVRANFNLAQGLNFDWNGRPYSSPNIPGFFKTGIDYEESAANLVFLIQKAELKKEDFKALENLTWVYPIANLSNVHAANELIH